MEEKEGERWPNTPWPRTPWGSSAPESRREPAESESQPDQGSVVGIWQDRTTAVATLSFAGRDRRSVVAKWR